METEEDRLATVAIRSGDPRQLEEAASLVADFPDGEDSLIGRRWILHAITEGPLATIDWMIEAGVDLSFRDQEGYTPLLAAIESQRQDRIDVLKRLIVAGAPLNAKGINDWTPAHMAAARDDVEVLRVLVDAGADLTIRTAIDDYATPLEEARNLEKADAVAFLEGLPATSADDSLFPGWRCVSEDGHPLVLELLQNHDIRVEVVPVGSLGKYSNQSLWVKTADVNRAADLIGQMVTALDTPSSGPWRCSGCGEENEAAFDACWQCGRDHAAG